MPPEDVMVRGCDVIESVLHRDEQFSRHNWQFLEAYMRIFSDRHQQDWRDACRLVGPSIMSRLTQLSHVPMFPRSLIHSGPNSLRYLTISPLHSFIMLRSVNELTAPICYVLVIKIHN
jgi:hypothetical protein